MLMLGLFRKSTSHCFKNQTLRGRIQILPKRFAQVATRFWLMLMFLQGAPCWFTKLPFKTETTVAAMKNGPLLTVATKCKPSNGGEGRFSNTSSGVV